MNRRAIILGIPVASLTATFSFAFSSAYAGATGTELAVVVGRNSTLKGISLNDLKAAYKGQLISGSNGETLVPFNFKNNTNLRVTFDQAVLGMDADASARYWIDRKIRGQRGAPKALQSPDVLKAVLTKLDNAIGYLPLGDVSAAHVRVIPVNGKLPGEAGYPVKA